LELHVTKLVELFAGKPFSIFIVLRNDVFGLVSIGYYLAAHELEAKYQIFFIAFIFDIIENDLIESETAFLLAINSTEPGQP
jgi:hypothetical protein